MNFFVKKISDVNLVELLTNKKVVLGLDIGNKTVGISVSDRSIKIASGLKTIFRNNTERDFKQIVEIASSYDIGLIVFGWPIQMNGMPGDQCEKILDFVTELHNYIPVEFSKWDERFTTKVVENVMIKADLSRKKRKQVIDKGASTYMLQGAIDLLNNNCHKITR